MSECDLYGDGYADGYADGRVANVKIRSGDSVLNVLLLTWMEFEMLLKVYPTKHLLASPLIRELEEHLTELVELRKKEVVDDQS